MRYITKTCPHCNYQIVWHSSDSGKKFGSPLRQCPKCKNTYYDKQYEEPALYTKSRLLINRILGTIKTFIVFFAISIMFGGFASMLSTDENIKSILFLVTSIFTVLILLFLWFKSEPYYNFKDSEEVKESIKRLENKEYREILIAHGVYIPYNSYFRLYSSQKDDFISFS